MVAIKEGPDAIKQKAIRTEWPVDEGLIAGTTRQSGEQFLHPQTESLVLHRENKYL